METSSSAQLRLPAIDEIKERRRLRKEAEAEKREKLNELAEQAKTTGLVREITAFQKHLDNISPLIEAEGKAVLDRLWRSTSKGYSFLQQIKNEEVNPVLVDDYHHGGNWTYASNTEFWQAVRQSLPPGYKLSVKTQPHYCSGWLENNTRYATLTAVLEEEPVEPTRLERALDSKFLRVVWATTLTATIIFMIFGALL